MDDVKVTQEDREAAEDSLGYTSCVMPSEAEKFEIEELAESFARHRIAAERRAYNQAIDDAAKVTEAVQGPPFVLYGNIPATIASRIRALSKEQSDG